MSWVRSVTDVSGLDYRSLSVRSPSKLAGQTARHLLFCRKRFLAKALPGPDLKYRSQPASRHLQSPHTSEGRPASTCSWKRPNLAEEMQIEVRLCCVTPPGSTRERELTLNKRPHLIPI